MTIANYILKHYELKENEYVVISNDGNHVSVIVPEQDGSMTGMKFRAAGTSYRLVGDFEPTAEEIDQVKKALRPSKKTSKTVSFKIGNKVEADAVFIERRCGYPVLLSGDQEFVVGFWARIDFEQGDSVKLSGDITRTVNVKGKELPLMKNFTRVA